MRADSALLPVAYYLYRRNAPANYITHSQFAADREAIRGWLIRSLLKSSGIWGSGLDTLLTALREAIQAHGAELFPVEQLRQVMVQRGKSLSFEPAEVEDLVHMEYGDKRLFALMSLLFPFVDLRNQFHIDHVFPISRFSRSKLLRAGLDEEAADRLGRRANQLSNLQLLDGAINNEKCAAMPAEWLAKHCPEAGSAAHYREKHQLGELPQALDGFEAFYEARRDRLRTALASLLSSPVAAAETVAA